MVWSGWYFKIKLRVYKVAFGYTTLKIRIRRAERHTHFWHAYRYVTYSAHGHSGGRVQQRPETFTSTPRLQSHTGCPRRKGPNFGRVFLRSNYTDITQNTYIQSSMVTEILAREVWTLTAITHLLITKYILKLAGICAFCNVNICT